MIEVHSERTNRRVDRSVREVFRIDLVEKLAKFLDVGLFGLFLEQHAGLIEDSFGRQDGHVVIRSVSSPRRSEISA